MAKKSMIEDVVEKLQAILSKNFKINKYTITPTILHTELVRIEPPGISKLWGDPKDPEASNAFVEILSQGTYQGNEEASGIKLTAEASVGEDLEIEINDTPIALIYSIDELLRWILSTKDSRCRTFIGDWAIQSVVDLIQKRVGSSWVWLASAVHLEIAKKVDEWLATGRDWFELQFCEEDIWKPSSITSTGSLTYYTNAVHLAYSGLNSCEQKMAKELDRFCINHPGAIWVRNPSSTAGGGYNIPLPVKTGGSVNFFPDFILWYNNWVYFVEYKGSDRTKEQVPGKMLPLTGKHKIAIITDEDFGYRLWVNDLPKEGLFATGYTQIFDILTKEKECKQQCSLDY